MTLVMELAVAEADKVPLPEVSSSGPEMPFKPLVVVLDLGKRLLLNEAVADMGVAAEEAGVSVSSSAPPVSLLADVERRRLTSRKRFISLPSPSM